MTKLVSPEELARRFHEHYERLAPSFDYETKKETAVPWSKVPSNNQRLMMAVAAAILLEFFPDRMMLDLDPRLDGTPSPLPSE